MIITRIWGRKTDAYFCISSKSASGKWRDHFFKRDDFGDIPKFLHDHQDRDLYFCPHGFSKPRRLKQYAIAPRCLWSDMDAADPRLLKIKPTVAIESSPGRYVGIWILKGDWSRKTPESERIARLQSVNRRLSKMIGGDPTGWDFTQVLRIPGTTNYKYTTTPRVKLLWADGPWYELEEIEKQLPEETPTDNITIEGDAARVYKEWHKKMPPWLRRELTRRTVPAQGTRSDMMFKIAATCVEIGMDRDETLLMLQMTPWNKYAGRSDEAKRLYDLWDRAINKKGQATREVAGESEDDHYVYLARSMAEIEERDIEWIWYGFLARGEVTILSGDPGIGKSFIAANICKAICEGQPLPTYSKYAPPPVKGRVAVFDIENSPNKVTKKRLKWADITLEGLRNFYQDDMPFSINDEEEMEHVYDALERIKPELIVFDTLNTYIGTVDTNKGAEGQQAFIRFKKLAERFNCAVLVLRHLTKSSREKAIYRGQGNIAFTGIARIEILAGKHPDEEDVYAIAQVKNNLCAMPPTLTFELDRRPKDVAKFIWGDFDRQLTADQIISEPEKKKSTRERDTAKELLVEALRDGERDSEEIKRMAEARSISQRTLYRAKEELGIVARISGRGKNRTTVWQLPESFDVESEMRSV